MLPRMTTRDALKYNVQYRERQIAKMRSMPWDTNLLNAFHNLHFILYMADVNPDFSTEVGDGKRPQYKMDVPGRDLWVMQLIMKAASDCLRDGFIRANAKAKCAISPYITKDGTFGFKVIGDCVYNLYVDFNPTVKANGTFGCTYNVHMVCTTWDYNIIPLKSHRARNFLLTGNMIMMRDYIKKELSRFTKMLENAEFNQPENSLLNLNGKGN